MILPLKLTRFLLLDLFGSQREGGEQLNEYLDDHLSHRDCRRDLCIDLEAPQKVFDRLEQVHQRIVAVFDALDRLIDRFRCQEDARLETKVRHTRRIGHRGLCLLPPQGGNSIRKLRILSTELIRM